MALAAEQEAKRGLQVKLTDAEKRRQTAEDALHDVKKSNKAAAKVISLATCLKAKSLAIFCASASFCYQLT